MEPRRETELRTALRLSAMSAVLGYDERLLYFVFHHRERRLRETPDELIDEARAMSSGERILIQCAIDLWSGQGGAVLGEILAQLDDDCFLNLIRGLLQFREIDDERRLSLLSYQKTSRA
jgi:hypothetical protein